MLDEYKQITLDNLTPALTEQCRSLLNWNMGRLARLSDIPLTTLKQYVRGQITCTEKTRNKLVRLFNENGVLLSGGSPIFMPSATQSA